MNTWPNTDLPKREDQERWEFLARVIRERGRVILALDDAAPPGFPTGYKIDNWAGDSLPMAIDFAIGMEKKKSADQ